MTNQFLSNPKILKSVSAIAGKEYNHYSLVLMLKSLIYKHLRITANPNVINDLIDSLVYEGSLKSFWKIDKENGKPSRHFVFDQLKFSNRFIKSKPSVANIFLDLEGTLIDDIESCNYIEENCKAISNFIRTYSADTIKVHIFTWAFLQRSEITKDANYNMLKNIEQKIGHIISSYVVKEDSLLHHASVQGIERIDLPEYEVAVYDSGFTKEQSFIEMFKESSFRETHILIDDYVTEPKAINFIKDNLYTIDFCNPNMIFLNPKNL